MTHPMRSPARVLVVIVAALGLLCAGGLPLVVLTFVVVREAGEREDELAASAQRWTTSVSLWEHRRDTARERWEALQTSRLEQERVVRAGMEAQAREREEDAARRAKEGLTVCNFTSAQAIDVAVVTWEEARDAWMGHGWYKAANGECKKILNTIEGTRVYLHGRSGNRVWGGDHEFCTTSAAFTLMDPGRGACRGGSTRGFSEVRTPADRAYTWRLVDG